MEREEEFRGKEGRTSEEEDEEERSMGRREGEDEGVCGDEIEEEDRLAVEEGKRMASMNRCEAGMVGEERKAS